MKKNKAKNIPSFRSHNDLIEFFDSHDLGEYLEDMPEVHFEVDIKRRVHLFALDEKIADKLFQIAKHKRITSEALINAWMKEKIQDQTL